MKRIKDMVLLSQGTATDHKKEYLAMYFHA